MRRRGLSNPTRAVRIAWGLAALALLAAAPPVTAVAIDDGEAQASIAILQIEKRGGTPAADDWRRLFESRGYQRLKQREADFKRTFSDDNFRAFLANPKEVAKADALQTTLAAWRVRDLGEMESRARSYLPAGASLRATVYPLVKPRTNSFVYQLDTDPAIMLYLDPEQTADQFSNTVSHELLHVGDAENCPPADVARLEDALPSRQKQFADWLSAFGEGWAVLAAAGGPSVNPHWEDPQHERDAWQQQMGRFDADFGDLQTFFSSIADGTLQGDAVAARGMTFFGADQGPWYTVGYRMDITIEKQLGRHALIAALCDKRTYFQTYNAAATEANRGASKPLPLWDPKLANFL